MELTRRRFVRWLPGVLSVCLLAPATRLQAQVDFLRGDVDCNGCVNFIDAVQLARNLFQGLTLPCDCEGARDANDDGLVNIQDTIVLLTFVLLAGPAPPAPFPTCGPPPAGSLTCNVYGACPLFKRGDADQNGCVNMDDAIFVANFLFMGGPPPACMNSADANDDDIVDQTDVNFLLAYCSTGGSPPLAPGPFQCGEDPTPGALPCGNYSASACCAGCINQLPSDCNQDGVVDISDAVCLLGNLFLGTPALLPCGDGLSADPSNILLLDANGDSLLDISDGVYVLNFLFIGGPPPLSGSTCLYIQGCPQNSVCPECTL